MACLHGDSAGRDSKYPAEVLKEHWHGDEAVERVLKAVSNPTDTNSLWAATPRVILPALAPASVASRLMRPATRRCRKRFSFSHITTIVHFNTRNDVVIES